MVGGLRVLKGRGWEWDEDDGERVRVGGGEGWDTSEVKKLVLNDCFERTTLKYVFERIEMRCAEAPSRD